MTNVDLVTLKVAWILFRLRLHCKTSELYLI